jgi:hypothetical protein
MPIMRCVISMRFFGQLNQNVLHLNTAETGATEEQVADYIDSFWVDQIKIGCNSSLLFFNIGVKNVSSGGAAQFDKIISKTGSQSAESQTCAFAAWVLKFGTGLAGRKFRGRAYIPGYRFGDQQFGQITAGGLALWNPILTQLRLKFTQGGGGAHYLVIRGSGGEPHDTAVQTIQIRNTMGSMRTRNIGVGA